MKKNNTKVKDQVKSPKRTFMAYGSKKPLIVLKSFRASNSIGSPCTEAIFYVIKYGINNLLGKETSKTLGMLKIGVYAVSSIAPFPKLKNILVDIPIE